MARIPKSTKQSRTTKSNPANSQPSGLSALLEQTSCFVPFNLVSQCGYDRVIYYNANASPDALYRCATERLKAVLQLLDSIHEHGSSEADGLRAVSSVSAFLLNDALCMLEEFNPVAARLRASNSAPK